jgi:hypothetical protein
MNKDILVVGDIHITPLCQYGCGQKAINQFKNGILSCSKHPSACPQKRKEKSKRMKGSKNPSYGTKCHWAGKVYPRKEMKNTIERGNK